MTAKLVPPELINLDNEMEDFVRQHTSVVPMKYCMEHYEHTWVPTDSPCKSVADYRQQISDPVADYLNAHPPKEKPWKLRAMIVLGLAIWFWWQVGEYVMRMAR
jgi:hypothetical protein